MSRLLDGCDRLGFLPPQIFLFLVTCVRVIGSLCHNCFILGMCIQIINLVVCVIDCIKRYIILKYANEKYERNDTLNIQLTKCIKKLQV